MEDSNFKKLSGVSESFIEFMSPAKIFMSETTGTSTGRSSSSIYRFGPLGWIIDNGSHHLQTCFPFIQLYNSLGQSLLLRLAGSLLRKRQLALMLDGTLLQEQASYSWNQIRCVSGLMLEEDLLPIIRPIARNCKSHLSK